MLNMLNKGDKMKINDNFKYIKRYQILTPSLLTSTIYFLDQ